jgi:hypothetical protein
MPIQLSGSLAITGSLTTSTTIGAQGAINTANTTNPISFTSTASLYSDGGMRLTKDLYVSGTSYFNNVTVYGTQSVQYITSSQLNIGTNIISVNTDVPTIRFGGLSVYDSGSTGLTGSILWDSEANHWVYTNPSGSTYSGGMFISGPRSSALGSEQGTTACRLLVGQGGDHLTSSMIYHDSTVTCVPNTLIGSTVCSTMANASCIGIGTQTPGASLDITSGAALSANLNSSQNTYLRFQKSGTSFGDIGNAESLTSGGNACDFAIHARNTGNIILATNFTEKARIDSSGNLTVGSISAGNAGSINVSVGCAGTTAGGLQLWAATNQTHYVQFGDGTAGGAPYAGYVAYAHATDSLSLGTATATRVTISSTGVACFSNIVCAPNATISNCLGVGVTSPQGNFEVVGLSYFTRANNSLLVNPNYGGAGTHTQLQVVCNMALAFATCGDNERMRITSDGVVGIGTNTPVIQDGNLAVAGCVGTGQGITCTTAQINIWETTSGNKAGLWFGAVNCANVGVIGSRTATGNIAFQTYCGAWAERMRITYNGNIGIGTTSPAEKLEVSGTSNVYGKITSTNGANAGIRFNSSGTREYGIFSDGALRFYDFTDATERMRITSDGYVGIGTTSPNISGGLAGNTLLTMKATTAQRVAIIELNGCRSGTGEPSSYIFAYNNSCTTPFGAIRFNRGSVDGCGCITLATSGIDRLAINPSGNVGIGTTCPVTTNLIGSVTIVKSYNGDTPPSPSAQSYDINQSNLYLFGRNAGITLVGALNEEAVIAFGNPSDPYIGGIRYSMGSGADSGDLVIQTGGTNERMRITSGGCVGIGTTSPGAKLDIRGSGNGYALQIFQGASGSLAGVYFENTGSIALSSARMWLDNLDNFVIARGGGNDRIGLAISASGAIGINTLPTSTARLTVSGSTSVVNFQGSGSNIFTVDGTSGRLFSVDDDLTNSLFSVNTITGLPVIEAFADNTVKLGKYSAASGSAMTITGSNHVYINTPVNPVTDNAVPQLGILAGSGTDAMNIKHIQNGNNTLNIWQTGTTSHNAIAFYKGDTQTNRGLITVTTSGTTYNSVSDYRLKENIISLENGLDRVLQLKPSKFNWIETGDESEGFIAHEIQEIFPDAVTGEKDAVYSSTGNIKPQSVDYGRITPLLVKAIQELTARVKELENK